MKDKKFDCVEFKHRLHREAYNESGAKTLKDYISYVNSKTVKSAPALKRKKVKV
jgi:hypothetical protein